MASRGEERSLTVSAKMYTALLLHDARIADIMVKTLYIQADSTMARKADWIGLPPTAWRDSPSRRSLRCDRMYSLLMSITTQVSSVRMRWVQ